MSIDQDGPPVRRLPAAFVGAILVVLVVGVATVAAAVHTAAGPGSPVAVPTPLTAADTGSTSSSSTTSTSSSSTGSSALAAPPDRCQAATFGSPLEPLNPPSDLHKYSGPPPVTIDSGKLYEATLTTTRGVIVVCLDPQFAPNTVNNFVTLARNHYYDGLKWHRVVAGFVIQGGDPLGTGSGGPGYSFPDETVKYSYQVGALAMANSGPNTNGSQFFVCTGSQCPPLPPKYNLFGVVVTGQDVAGKIAQGDVMTTVTVAQSQ